MKNVLKKSISVLMAFSMILGSLSMMKVTAKAAEDSTEVPVYSGEKTARWTSEDTVEIDLSCYFEGTKDIKDGNVLFLGTRCSAHGLDSGTSGSRWEEGTEGTLVKSVNAMAPYANVQYYFFNKEETGTNVKGYVGIGQTVKELTYKDNPSTTTGNHHAATEFAQTLYTELKRTNIKYDLIVLEFDGDLIDYKGSSIYGDQDNSNRFVDITAVTAGLHCPKTAGDFCP